MRTNTRTGIQDNNSSQLPVYATMKRRNVEYYYIIILGQNERVYKVTFRLIKFYSIKIVERRPNNWPLHFIVVRALYVDIDEKTFRKHFNMLLCEQNI